MPFQELNKAQLTLHHAVQLIAVSGKYLLEEKEDDSHTNMEWDSETNTFFGGIISNRAKVGFHVPSFSLKVEGPFGIELASLNMVGKTKQEALIWLKQALQLKQINTDDLELELHYEIPEHEVDKERPFPEIDSNLLLQLVEHRTIADKICVAVSKEFIDSSTVRTWPHHFDHGVYIPFKFDEKEKVTQSFSVGYAVADSLIKEPYFYVTQWKKGEEVDYSTAPKLKKGEWLPEELIGAALRFSELGENISENIINQFVQVAKDWSIRA